MSVNKFYDGVVTKVNDSRTISVSVTNYYKYPVYGKIVKKNRIFLSDFDKNLVGFEIDRISVGDKVSIKGVPKLSKKKYFSIVKKY